MPGGRREDRMAPDPAAAHAETPLSKPFLILQLRPEDETADGEFDAFLRYGGLRPAEVDRVRLDREPFPAVSLEQYSAILVGGSPFDMTTPPEDKGPVQLGVEAGFAALLARVVEVDFPFLGACSGSSLLGTHCGASISRRWAEPVGAANVTVTDAGAADPLLMGFPRRFRVLLGHKEACDDVPPGAVLLARGDHCPVQMFRVGANVYATQFHPEGDPEGFALRIRVYREHGYFPPERADTLIDALRDEATPVPQAILRRFVERYRVA